MIDGKSYGVMQICKKFNRKKNCGTATSKVYKASGGITRAIFQNLEKLGFIETTVDQQRKGRVITKAGRSFVDKCAVELLKSKLI